MKKMLILSGVFLLSQLTAQSSSQNSTLKDAFHFFESKDYISAISAFEKETTAALDAKSLSALALSYKRTGQNEKAEDLYAQLVLSPDADPEARYEYADLLKGHGDFLKAKKYFLEYANFNPVIGNYFAETCDYSLQQLNKPNNCKLTNLESNSAYADFAPMLIDEELVFVSGQKNEFTLKSGSVQAASEATQAVTRKFSEGLIELLSKEASGLGNISINENKTACAFSKASDYDLERILMHDIKLQIHLANIEENGSWNNIQPFAYNVDGYSVGFPCLAETGNVLYFASNQPGGYGGYDLYVSFKSPESSEWSKPHNLGAVINSDGNELSPFYKNGVLYFSSDWHTGFGGLDVFKTQLVDGHGAVIENLGTCVNSSMDEYYFILDNENQAYFTSNRYGGKGADDIYRSFQLKVATESQTMALKPVAQTQEVKSELKSEVKSEEKPAAIAEENLLASEALVADQLVPQTRKAAQEPKLYFIQIASLTKYNSKMDSRFTNYTSYGDVYKFKVDDVMKIRIGGFSDINEAVAAMKIMKANGTKDAFIVTDVLGGDRVVLLANAVGKSESPKVTGKQVENTPVPQQEEEPEEEGKYKIRVAEYKAPDWFDVSKINDLGKIEHWTKSGLTIIVLGSYTSETAAKDVLSKLKTRGFKESYLVVEENGKLYRL